MKTASSQPPLVVMAAGSLRNAFVDIVSEFERRSGVAIRVEHGPAGLLREKIEEGAQFDVFASANMDHPERLTALGLAGPVLCFTSNSLCVIARRNLGITDRNLLEILTDRSVRIGTSTPKADPSGDYAIQFFENVERYHLGMGSLLSDKAQPLVGGRNSAPIPPGHTPAGYLIGQGTVDVFISYASNGALSHSDADLAVLPIPASLGPTARYGITLRKGVTGAASMFRNHLFTSETKVTLTRHGFY